MKDVLTIIQRRMEGLQGEEREVADEIILSAVRQIDGYESRGNCAWTWETDFNKNYAVTGIEWKWDTPDGNPDSVAFRDWYNSSNATSGNYIYLIDRVPDVLSDRYKKMQLTGVNADQYTFICANPDGSSQSGFIIEKDTTYSYSYFTFNVGRETGRD